MNVYDFDKTIYAGDSTLDFYLFCLTKQPRLLLCLPQQILGYLLYIIGRYDKDRFKESFFCFLTKLDSAIPREAWVDKFWDRHAGKIRPWYLAQQKTDDVIISASPEFLLLPICRHLQIRHLIATKVDARTGRFNGPNCFGPAKVERLRQYLRQATANPIEDPGTNAQAKLRIDAFYSDSLSDAPWAALAKRSYIVQGDRFIPWEQYQPSRRQKLWDMFFSRSFVLFMLIGMINAVNGIVFAYLYALITYTNVGFILGYITSLTISYILNSKITFGAPLCLRKYIKFCIAYIPNFLTQNAIVMLFYNFLSWPKLTAFILAALFGVPITFALMKLYAFKL